MSPPEPPVSTPCRRLCALDGGGLCTGCGRSRGEIAAWGGLSEAERRHIMARIAAERPGRAALDKASRSP